MNKTEAEGFYQTDGAMISFYNIIIFKLIGVKNSKFISQFKHFSFFRLNTMGNKSQFYFS
jgi:hypothetical protein